VHYGPTAAEAGSVKHRRSIYVARSLAAGDVLTRDNLRCIRPGAGLATKHYDALLGRRVNQAVERGTPMRWSLLEPADDQ
jgi:N-acetylneuraminate synthase